MPISNQPYAGLNVGRCIGHGAVPVSVRDNVYAQLADLDDSPALTESKRLAIRGGVFAHGYATLRLHGETCEAGYVQLLDGGKDEVHREVFS